METLAMTRRERRRLEVLSRVKSGRLTLVKAAELLELSYRQAKRVYGRYREQGDAGLVHRLRGKASNRGRPAADREAVLAAYRAKYSDFGPTLAAEYLAREEGVHVSVSTLWRWLKQAGLWQARRRRDEHRRWRPPKEHFGEMLQMDGSHHDWFEGRRAWSVLMVAIDDATRTTHARFFEQETTAAAMTTFKDWVARHGLPQSLYVDRDSIYEATRDATSDEELRETGPLTQFGRAMHELSVRLILAHSPQAKGRVERRHAVFQDRLVKALRLAKISDLEAANRLLEESFLPELNRRFTTAARQPANLHRRVPRDVKLEQVLAFQETRVVQNDWTVAWRSRCFQLLGAGTKLALVRRRITVCEQLDGTIRLLHGGRELKWKELTERPARSVQQPTGPTRTGCVGLRPAADHPWRRDSIRPATPAGRVRPPRSASVAALPALREAGG